MSNKEIAKNLIDQIPESKLLYIIPYLQGAAIPEKTPNAETLEAFAEGEQILKEGTGQRFTNTADLFASLEE